MAAKNGFARGVVAVLLIVVAGCDGGDDSQATPRVSALAGKWEGSATDTTTGRVMNAHAFIDDSGVAQFIVTPPFAGLGEPILSSLTPLLRNPVPVGPVSGGSATSGVIIAAAGPYFVVYGDTCCQSDFQASLDAQELLTTARSKLRVSGSLSSGMLIGTLDFDGKPYSFSLAPSLDSARSLTLQELAGVYTSELPAFLGSPASTQYTLSVSPNGMISGSHVNGCIFNGTVNIPNSSRNLFHLRMQISNCNPTSPQVVMSNGDYEGLGTLLHNVVTITDVNSTNFIARDMFYFSLIGPVWLGTQGALR